MKAKEIATIVIILSLFGTLTWIFGLIDGNILLFLASILILSVFTIPIVISNYDDLNTVFKKDEKRLSLANEKVYEAAFGISTGVLFYTGIGLVTLRINHPELAISGIIVLMMVVVNLIIFLLTRKYYENKYLNSRTI